MNADAPVGAVTEDEQNALDESLADSGCHGFMGDHEPLYAVASQIKAAARAEERERIAAELHAYAEHYPEDVFLGPQPEDDQYAVMHGASGMARHIYTNVAPSIARADAPREGER